MPRNLTVHIGPFKTGSTTVQRTLHKHRDELRAAGVLVPQLAGGGASTEAATFDLLAIHADAGPPRRAWTRFLVRGYSAHYAAAWQALVGQISSYEGDAVISDEHLSDLRPGQVAAFLDTFADFRVRVVVVARPMSRVLPSDWQEQSKLLFQPDFERYARRWAESLAAPEGSDSAYLDAHQVAGTWRAAGAEVAVVEARPDISSATVQQVVRSLVPAGVDVPLEGRANPRLSAAGIDLWREHVRGARPTFAGATRATLAEFLRLHPWVTDPGKGGRYVITRDAAPLVDEPGDGAALAAHLASGAPLTTRLAGPAEPSGAGRAALLAELRRQQRRHDLAWAAWDRLARLRRAQRPVRSDWDFALRGQPAISR